MASDVVAPPPISCIAGSCGKVGLESQALPGNNRITGKSDGVSVASDSGISGKGETPFSSPGTVQIMKMVQHPKRIQSRNLCDGSLLPVQPPEINALVLQRMMQLLKVHLQKMPVRHIKRHRLPAFWIYSHTFRHPLVGLLIGTYPVRRMYIQCDLHISAVKPVHKLFWVREKLTVPGISGPAASVFRINIHQMPVHIHNGHREGNPLPLKTLHQLLVFLLCVSVIAAPPVSEHPSGQQWCSAAEIVEVLYCLLIPVAIAEEIEINTSLRTQVHPSILCNCHTAAVIHNGKSVSRHHTAFQRNSPVRLVQSACCSSQIFYRVLIMPVRLIGFSACHFDKKTVWGKFLFVVGKLQGTGKDFQFPLCL